MASMKENHEEDKACNILVIDDDKRICRLFHAILTRNNYYVEAFTDSREALERFEEYPFDAVITDLQMPDLSGWDVAQRVKKKDPSLPVILVTGSMVDHDEESLNKRGIDFLVRKPIRLEEFLKIVTRALGTSFAK